MIDHEHIKKIILESKTPLFIYSKLTKEGLISSAILIQLLKNLNKKFSINFFQKIDENKIMEINVNHNENIIILDLNKQDLENISKLKKQVVIIREHNSIQVYEIAKSLDNRIKDIAYLNLITLKNLNNQELLKEAESQIRIIKGLKILGSNTRPIHKTVELSFDPFIIGFSGSEENSINLFKDLEINLKSGTSWTCIQDLTENQIEKLLNSLSLNTFPDEKLFEEKFILESENRNSPFKDLHEYSLFLEACILFNKPSIAVSKLLIVQSYKNRALDILTRYRQDIIKALSLFYLGKDEELIIEKENCVIINFKDKISNLILKKAIELIQNSKLYPQEKRIIGLCHQNLEEIKCSISYFDNKPDLNIENLMNALSSDMRITSSEMCLGLLLPLNQEKRIIELILEHLESVRIEQIKEN